MSEERDERPVQYRLAFESDCGRAVLADLMSFCGLLNETHAPGDPAETAFREGKRAVALYVIRVMQGTPMPPKPEDVALASLERMFPGILSGASG